MRSLLHLQCPRPSLEQICMSQEPPSTLAPATFQCQVLDSKIWGLSPCPQLRAKTSVVSQATLFSLALPCPAPPPCPVLFVLPLSCPALLCTVPALPFVVLPKPLPYSALSCSCPCPATYWPARCCPALYLMELPWYIAPCQAIARLLITAYVAFAHTTNLPNQLYPAVTNVSDEHNLIVFECTCTNTTHANRPVHLLRYSMQCFAKQGVALHSLQNAQQCCLWIMLSGRRANASRGSSSY